MNIQSTIAELQSRNFVAEYDEKLNSILAGTEYRQHRPGVVGRASPFTLTYSEGWLLKIWIRQLLYAQPVNTIEQATRIVRKIYARPTKAIGEVPDIDTVLGQLHKQGFHASIQEAKARYIRVEGEDRSQQPMSFNIFCEGEYFLLLQREPESLGHLIFGAETLEEIAAYLPSMKGE